MRSFSDENAAAYLAGGEAMRDGRSLAEARRVPGPPFPGQPADVDVDDLRQRDPLQEAWRDGWLDELAAKVRALEQGIVR